MRLSLLCSTLVIVGAAVAVPAQRVLNVPARYATIQAAIQAARNNDTVLVAPGVYSGTVDFAGKDITVRSTDGPEVTVISGGGPVVRFRSGQTNAAVLDGFTVTAGTGGIVADGAGPTILNNIVTQNTARSSGAGVYVRSTGAPAIIRGNRIEKNQVFEIVLSIAFEGGGAHCENALLEGNIIVDNELQSYAFSSSESRGGGVWCRNATLRDNVIARNLAANFSAPRPLAAGGGIYADSNVQIVNCTVASNRCVCPASSGGGIAAGVNTTITNCIVRENQANTFPEMLGTASYSNVKGGGGANHNIDADPLFAEPAADDFHLLGGSPCRDRGTTSIPVDPTDFEGDPRISGAGLDMGADEFHPHLYHAGEARPGKTFSVRLIGPPSSQALLGYAARTISPPLPVPGSGSLHLDPATLQVMYLGPFPSTGLIKVAISIPTHAPTGTVPTQALIGIALSNLHWIRVVP
jgi:hypothetical protein